MFKSLTLENFKAFGERVTIPMAPITLLFGPNSAGKSSILQSLNLLKQTRENPDGDTLLARTENGYTDLGSFQELLFDHDLQRDLAIRVDVSANARQFSAIGPIGRRLLKTTAELGLEMSFSRRNDNDEITLNRLSLFTDNGNEPLAKFEKAGADDVRHARMQYQYERRSIVKSYNAFRCTEIAALESFWSPYWSALLETRAQLSRPLTSLKESLSLATRFPDLNDPLEDIEGGVSKRDHLIAAIDQHREFLSTEFSLSEYIGWVKQHQMDRLIGVNAFIPTGPVPFVDNSDTSLDGLARYFDRLPDRRMMAASGSIDVTWLTGITGTLVEKNLSALFPLGPFRKPPLRWYVFTGTTPVDVGRQGHLLPDLLLRNKTILEETNNWLKNLAIHYEIQPRPLGHSASDLFEVRLRDTRRASNVDVGLADVGFGISQILPFVVQSLASRDQTISVEQPEVHIHPRLQADLGDLLIAAVQEPRRNQFLIETHSEHLALRLQRRIREKKLAPEMVSIIYVERGPTGSTVKPLRLDHEGDFIDDLPGGFFPERLNELR
jgi:predicted ATPase